MRNDYDDYPSDLMIIWKCDKCGAEREDYPDYNEGGFCECGGVWMKSGETYSM